MSTVKANTIEPASGGTVTITGAALTTPALGTPASGNLANCTGLPASSVVNTPSGGISATTVQAALNELDTAVAARLPKSGGTMTNNIAFAAGKGIDFSANSSAPGMTSEVFDDYEEGTWSPIYSTSTPPTTPFTMAVTSATYTKVGRMVNVRAVLGTNDVNTAGCAGVLVIQGLPFASQFGANGQTPVLVARAESWGGDYPGGGYVEGGTTEINLQYRTAVNSATLFMNAADLTAGAVANQNVVQISATYYV